MKNHECPLCGWKQNEQDIIVEYGQALLLRDSLVAQLNKISERLRFLKRSRRRMKKKRINSNNLSHEIAEMELERTVLQEELKELNRRIAMLLRHLPEAVDIFDAFRDAEMARAAIKRVAS